MRGLRSHASAGFSALGILVRSFGLDLANLGLVLQALHFAPLVVQMTELEQAEENLQSLLWELDAHVERRAPSQAWPRLTASVTTCWLAIQELEEDEIYGASAAWRSRFHPWFLQAPCIRRAYEKPLGYAGDFGVMDLGYRNIPEAETPMGNLLHGWFSTALRGSTAVRARRRWIGLEMQRHAARSMGLWRGMSLASGSSWELRDMVHESWLIHRANMTCVDQDPRALAAAEEGLREAETKHGRTLDAIFLRQSVREVIRGGLGDLPKQDFVYSLGLYDYLPKVPAQLLTTVLARQLRPGGRLIVGNYLVGHDTQPVLELVMDWFLIGRSPEQIEDLVSDLGRDYSARVQIDSTGSIGFLVVDFASVTSA